MKGLRHAIFEQLRHVRRERVARYLNLAGASLSLYSLCRLLVCQEAKHACASWCSLLRFYAFLFYDRRVFPVRWTGLDLGGAQLGGVDLAGASLRDMNLKVRARIHSACCWRHDCVDRICCGCNEKHKRVRIWMARRCVAPICAIRY